jgi:tetratricopeptide (TPR) repeat protein
MRQALSGSFLYRSFGFGVALTFGLVIAGQSFAQPEGIQSPTFGQPEQQPPAAPMPGDPTAPAVPGPGPAPAPMPGEQPAPAPAQQAPAPMDQPLPQAAVKTPVDEQITLGLELMNQGKSELALQHFEEATKLAEDRSQEKADAFFQLGNAFRSLDRFDEAIDAYGKSIPNNSQVVDSYLRRGIVWFYKGEYSIAWNDFDEAASIVRRQDEPYPEFWKGLAKAQQGAWLDAVNSYTESLLRDKHFALAYTNRGLAYLQLNEPHKAMADFNQAIRNDPNGAAHYFRRGVAQTQLGRIPDAIESYNQALRLDPNNSEAAKNRELLERRAGR